MAEAGSSRIESAKTFAWRKLDADHDFKAVTNFLLKEMKNPHMSEIGEELSKWERFMVRVLTTASTLKIIDDRLHLRDEELWALRSENGAIKGTLGITPIKFRKPGINDAAEITGMYISKDVPNSNKYLRQLLSILNEYCFTHKVPQVWFQANPKNTRAVRFYKSIAEQYEPKVRAPKDKDLYFVIDLDHSTDSKRPLFDAVLSWRKTTKNVEV